MICQSQTIQDTDYHNMHNVIQVNVIIQKVLPKSSGNSNSANKLVEVCPSAAKCLQYAS